MATIKQLYGTLTSLTVTNLASLANGSFWRSAQQDNEADLWVDVQVLLTLVNHASSAPTGEQACHLFAAAALDDSENMTDGVGTTEGTHTIAAEAHLHYLGSVYFSAANQTRTAGPFSLAQAFGGRIPSEWGLLVKNSTGFALNASGQIVKYRGIHYQTV